MPGELEDFGLGARSTPQPLPRAQIVVPVRHITAEKLSDLDVEQELLVQYKTGNLMLEAIINDTDIPANQKAQVYNSVSATIAQISAQRTKLYDSERVKKLEMCLIKVLQAFPEMHEAFMTAYKESLKNA